MMNEFIELRIKEDIACQYLPQNMGDRLGDNIRKVRIPTNGPLFDRIRYLDEKFSIEGTPFFYGWEFIRKYTSNELQTAKLFHLIITALFEPAGAECGTLYDESSACKICQAGRTQISELILDLRKVPKKKDIATTIASERIISQRLAQLLMDNNMTGFELNPIHHKARYQDDLFDLSLVPTGQKLLKNAEDIGLKKDTWEFMVWINRPENNNLWIKALEEYTVCSDIHLSRSNISMPKWYQLVITSHPLQTIKPTKFGIRPFDDDLDGRFRCPLGHTSGLNLLSELWLLKDDWDGSDICQTKDMVGVRRGLLVPRSLLLISSRLYKLLEKENIHGYKVEIAHI